MVVGGRTFGNWRNIAGLQLRRGKKPNRLLKKSSSNTVISFRCFHRVAQLLLGTGVPIAAFKLKEN